MSFLLIIGIILLVLWAIGLVTSRTLGGYIHFVLVIAVIMIMIYLLRVVFGIF